MIDFVPIQNYLYYFDITILCLIIIAVWQCHSGHILNKRTVYINAIWGIFFTILLIFYMGLRPIKAGYFGDSINYAKGFYWIQSSNTPFTWSWTGEWLFQNTFAWFAKNSDIHSFFLLCAFVYVGSFWLSTIRIFKNYYYIPFLTILGMFTFWQYGVNGIRNGLGASLFILSMTYVNTPKIMITIMLLACGCHSSIYLMAAAAGIAYFLKNSYYYLMGWGLCVILSYTAGMKIQNMLANLNIMGEDNRLSNYLSGDAQIGEIVQTSMEFRWDFLAYSAMAVIVGYYFIFQKKFKDEYYHWIYNTYLVTNAFWILVIRAAYSNRFAQISWFIMPIVLIYPFLKKRFWINHEKYLGYAIILFYLFTFYYNILKG